jgi:flagellar L-ring protein precursor FlgH
MWVDEMLRYAFLIGLMPLLSGCNLVDRLNALGNPPPLSPIQNPLMNPAYRPVSLPMPPATHYESSKNSLWRQGEKSFFKDQRASQVGDILTVIINLKDSAKLNNETSRGRNNSDKLGVDNFAGLETRIKKNHKSLNLAKMVGAGSSMNSKGTGTIKRDEEIKVNVAAVVTQVLPNNNLVILGRQEVRVNYEVRELQVAGIIRPEDITSENKINSEKIAEARISYGGRGHITDVQQPRYGQQFLDIILPY